MRWFLFLLLVWLASGAWYKGWLSPQVGVAIMSLIFIGALSYCLWAIDRADKRNPR